jgi:hypothetical protein
MNQQGGISSRYLFMLLAIVSVVIIIAVVIPPIHDASAEADSANMYDKYVGKYADQFRQDYDVSLDSDHEVEYDSFSDVLSKHRVNIIITIHNEGKRSMDNIVILTVEDDEDEVNRKGLDVDSREISVSAKTSKEFKIPIFLHEGVDTLHICIEPPKSEDPSDNCDDIDVSEYTVPNIAGSCEGGKKDCADYTNNCPSLPGPCESYCSQWDYFDLPYSTEQGKICGKWSCRGGEYTCENIASQVACEDANCAWVPN